MSKRTAPHPQLPVSALGGTAQAYPLSRRGLLALARSAQLRQGPIGDGGGEPKLTFRRGGGLVLQPVAYRLDE